jgi:hypothetical protein
MLSPIDQIVADFDSAWEADHRPEIGPFLDRASQDLRDKLLARLLQIDIQHQIRAGGTSVADDYAFLGPRAVDLAEQSLRQLNSQTDGANHSVVPPPDPDDPHPTVF